MEIRTAKLLESYALFLCFVVFGASSAALGASYPQLSKDITNDDVLTFSVFGRGIGFLCGLLCNLYVVGRVSMKYHMWSIVGFNIFSAIFTMALAFVADMPQYQVWLIVFPFLQGFGFSSCDALGNSYMFSIWRGDVDENAGKSWVHAIHAGFTGGGLLGPLLVGAIRYQAAFIVIALMTLLPLALLICAYAGHGLVIKEAPQEDTKNNEESPRYALNPTIVYLLQLLFFFLMGQEMVCSVWISTYTIKADISDSKAMAAYTGSAFYAAMLLGRLCMATFPAMKKTSNPVLLQQFVNFQLIASALLLLYGFTLRQYEDFDYAVLIIVLVIFGFSINSLIGMGINTVEDYKSLQQCPNLIVKEMIGLSIGEVTLPALVGVIFFAFHPYTLMVNLFLMGVIIYALHFVLKYLLEEQNRRDGIGEPLL